MAGAYFEPRTIDAAVAALAEHGGRAKLVAGGTDLVVLARKRRVPLADVLIAVHRVDELRGIEPAARGGPAVAYGAEWLGGLRIGATTTHAEIESHPDIRARFAALADGSALVGSPATRHVGTIGGNLANASPANETGSPLLVLGASIELTSADGIRDVHVSAFFEGPGRTALGPDEVISAITLRGVRRTGATGSAYIRLDYRRAMEIAVVGAAAVVNLDDEGRIAHARLALTAVAPTCIEVQGVADALYGLDPADPASWDEVGRLAARAAGPIDDVRASAAYRTAMIPVVVRRAFDLAVRRARGDGA